MPQPPTFPNAQAPERSYDLHSHGFRLRLHEWGDLRAPVIVLAHGMWDHSRGFDLLAPLLAERYRLVALDARGHGDSDWADGYSWLHDVNDIVSVLEHVGSAHLLGHSKGGGQVTDAAGVAPERVRKIVNIDGFGPPDDFDLPAELPAQPEPGTPEGFVSYLDARRRSHTRQDWRPYAQLSELVARRKRQNPRLSEAWLEYFCWHGSRQADDGFRWKVDPMAGMGAGPFKPEWIGPSWAHLRSPVLAIIGEEQDTWGPLPPEVLGRRMAYIPDVRLETIAGAGHFPHMEAPQAVAELVLDFLGQP